MAKITKKAKVLAGLDREKLYSVEEALATLRQYKSKFDETVEVAMNLGVDPRHADQMVRGMVSLPSGTGAARAAKIAVRAPLLYPLRSIAISMPSARARAATCSGVIARQSTNWSTA